MTTKQATTKLVPTMNQNKMQFDVSLTLIIKEKLTYEESEALAAELREQYLGKEVDLNLGPTFNRK